MTRGDQGGASLAAARARTALQSAGLDPSVPLRRASSVTNEVWMTPTHVVRVSRRHGGRLAREADLATSLPTEVGYPTVVAHGSGHGEDWLVSTRVPGEPLAHQWPDLSRDQRRSAVSQLAARVAALHRTLAPPDLAPLEGAPQLLRADADDPTGPLIDALDQLGHRPSAEPQLIAKAVAMVRRLGGALAPFDSGTLVHGDITFENVLWHDGELTAVLDLEWARPGPPDLDLDVLLRCCAHPQVHVAEPFAARTRAEDYAEVAIWLAEDYPALFGHPRLLDRLRVYSIAYDVHALFADPLDMAPSALPTLHPYHRLARVVRGRSYLDGQLLAD